MSEGVTSTFPAALPASLRLAFRDLPSVPELASSPPPTPAEPAAAFLEPRLHRKQWYASSTHLPNDQGPLWTCMLSAQKSVEDRTATLALRSSWQMRQCAAGWIHCLIAHSVAPRKS